MINKGLVDQDCGFCFVVILVVILLVRLEGTLNNPKSILPLELCSLGIED